MPKSNNKNQNTDPVVRKISSKPILVIIFILINVAVIAATAAAEFGNSENAAELSDVTINGWFLIPAVICFLVALTCEIHKYIMMMCEMSKKTNFDRKHARMVARRTVLLGKYYDNITPAAIGGQPFQIYYMHKNGRLPNGLATTIPIMAMVSGQLGFIIIAVLCFLFGSLSINNAALIGTACFGLLFYAFWPITIMIATFMPNGAKELITLIVKGLAKLHIVKNPEKTIKRIEFEVDAYAVSVRKILKTKGLFIKTILLSIGFNGFVAMIPFFVLTAFGGEVDFLPCFVTTVAVTAAVYFVPTPGNAGAAEGTFYVVFSALSQGYVFWAMLVWRFFSYYIFIIMGPVTYFIYILMGPIIYAKMYFEKKHEKEKNGVQKKKASKT